MDYNTSSWSLKDKIAFTVTPYTLKFKHSTCNYKVDLKLLHKGMCNLTQKMQHAVEEELKADIKAGSYFVLHGPLASPCLSSSQN